MNKILVCITIQQNSKRLIKKGSELASKLNGELHILHIQKGMSIFDEPNAVNLLESLFELGKELGGEVHFLSDTNVVDRILKTTKDMKITHMILGETSEKYLKNDKHIIKRIESEIGDVTVQILGRREL